MAARDGTSAAMTRGMRKGSVAQSSSGVNAAQLSECIHEFAQNDILVG